MPMKPQPMTQTMCITKEDLEKNPEASIPKPGKRGGSDCKVSDYKVDANTVSWNLKCEGQNPVSGSGKISYGADSYAGAMDMKIGDRDIKVKYSGKYLGAECDKK